MALVFFFCEYVCEVRSARLRGPAVGADTRPPRGTMVSKRERCEHTCVEHGGSTLSHNFPTDCLARDECDAALFLIILVNHHHI